MSTAWFIKGCDRITSGSLFSLRTVCFERMTSEITEYRMQDATSRGEEDVTHFPVVAVLGGDSLFPDSASSDHVTLSPALQYGNEICFFAMPSKQLNDVNSQCRAVCTSLQVRPLLCPPLVLATGIECAIRLLRFRCV